MKNFNLILLAIISLILLVSITSAQVSHPASEITAGTFGAGDYTITNTGEVFLSISNTEAGGHDYRLVSAGSVGGIGLGGFSIYDSTVGQSRLTIDSNGNVNIGGNLNLQNNRITNIADPIVSSDVATKSYVDARVVSVLGGDGDGDGVVGVMDCNDGNEDVWQIRLGFPDNDNDGYFSKTSPDPVCSGDELPEGYSSTAGDDCNDNCAACFPGSDAVTAAPDGRDQDCANGVDNFVSFSKTCPFGKKVAIPYTNDECKRYCKVDSATVSGDTRYSQWTTYPVGDFSNCGTWRHPIGHPEYFHGSGPVTCSCAVYK